MNSKRATFMILNSHASALIRKEKLSSTSKARREASRNKLMEKHKMLDRVQSLREVSSSKSCPIILFEFVEPIQK